MSLSTKYPRVVIVSTRPMGVSSASGIAIRSLFWDWERTRLTQIFAPFINSSTPDYEVCYDYRLLLWSGRIVRVNPSENKELNGLFKRIRFLKTGLSSIRKLQKWGTPFRYWWLGRKRYAQGLLNELANIRPDVVYAFIGSMPLAKAVFLACKSLELPLVIHIFDDYVNCFKIYNSTKMHLSSKAHFWQKCLTDYATGHVAISPPMAMEYSKRYGGEWTWFSTLADADAYSEEPRDLEPSGHIKIVYAGDLGFNRWRTLRQLGNALKKLYDEGLYSKLVIYANPIQIKTYQGRLGNLPIIELRNWVPLEQLPKIFYLADILVHVESSFNQEYVQSIKWSLSTKIGQLMMAGRCILAIGPPFLTSMEFIKANKAGIVIESEEVQNIADCLRVAFQDKSQLMSYGQNGRRRAIEMFEGNTQRERFRELIIAAIKKKWPQ